MREKDKTIMGVILGSKWSSDMASLIVAQIDRDGARPRIFYWRESDHDAEQMAKAIATLTNSHATMIPRGDMLADVQFCQDDVTANQGNFAIVGSFFDGVVPHLRHIGPKKGVKENSAFKVLQGIVDGGEAQVVTMKLPTTKSKQCPTATCSTVGPADDMVIGAVVSEPQKKVA